MNVFELVLSNDPMIQPQHHSFFTLHPSALRSSSERRGDSLRKPLRGNAGDANNHHSRPGKPKPGWPPDLHRPQEGGLALPRIGGGGSTERRKRGRGNASPSEMRDSPPAPCGCGGPQKNAASEPTQGPAASPCCERGWKGGPRRRRARRKCCGPSPQSGQQQEGSRGPGPPTDVSTTMRVAGGTRTKAARRARREADSVSTISRRGRSTRAAAEEASTAGRRGAERALARSPQFVWETGEHMRSTGAAVTKPTEPREPEPRFAAPAG